MPIFLFFKLRFIFFENVHIVIALHNSCCVNILLSEVLLYNFSEHACSQCSQCTSILFNSENLENEECTTVCTENITVVWYGTALLLCFLTQILSYFIFIGWNIPNIPESLRAKVWTFSQYRSLNIFMVKLKNECSYQYCNRSAITKGFWS